MALIGAKSARLLGWTSVLITSETWAERGLPVLRAYFSSVYPLKDVAQDLVALVMAIIAALSVSKRWYLAALFALLSAAIAVVSVAD
ncbi:MAG TPA: hypothetical protein VFI95_09115 [Terriglobales bacterium]|nr:hypothetical protein [Terriglobales bacterium]